MEKLNELINRCKCGVYVLINTHRDNYVSVSDTIKEMRDFKQIDNDELEETVLNKMIESDTIIDLQFYPNTPIGFYKILHYDLDLALDMALEVIRHREAN